MTSSCHFPMAGYTVRHLEITCNFFFVLAGNSRTFQEHSACAIFMFSLQASTWSVNTIQIKAQTAGF